VIDAETQLATETSITQSAPEHTFGTGKCDFSAEVTQPLLISPNVHFI